MTWYRSWYLPLKRKLFLSKKLRWRFYLASRSLYLRTTQIRQNASRPSICQLYIPIKLFQNVRIICHNNTFCYIYNLSSVDHTTSLTCSYFNVLNFFGQVVIQKIRSSYCLKDKIITSKLIFVLPIIHWSSNTRQFRILCRKFFNRWRCSKCQWVISNFPFNFFGNTSLILFWSTMWFIDFVYSKS